MERESGVVLPDSPTQRPGGTVIDSLQKVQHSKPMLSAAKTKDVETLKTFINAGNVPENPTPGKVIVSWKEDSLTIVLRYRDGHLIQAITRGDGSVGEDVTHSVRMYQNVPLQIPCEDEVEVRGEGMVAIADFENLPAHSRDFSRELAGRILSEKISSTADFFCSFCCTYGIIEMVIII